MKPEQALDNLYNASRLAKLTADDHALLVECARIIKKIIKPEPPKVDDINPK